MRIIRPSNSFIGERVNGLVSSQNIFVKKKKEVNNSEARNGNKTINLVINSKKQYNVQKIPTSMLFATQIN